MVLLMSCTSTIVDVIISDVGGISDIRSEYGIVGCLLSWLLLITRFSISFLVLSYMLTMHFCTILYAIIIRV